MICEDFNLYIVRRFYIHYTNHDKESIHDVVGVVVRNLTECIYSYRRGKTRRAF
jgi:isocitrate/isopropylmalate dehydrogenase